MKFSIEEHAPSGQIPLPIGSWRLQCSWSIEPSKLEFANHDTNAKLFRWYLQEFTIKEPLSSKKASSVEELLAQYQEKILSLLQVGQFAHHADRVVVDILDYGGKSSFHSLPWELLENSSQDQQLVVRRRTQMTKPHLADSKIQFQPESFNILLLSARSESNDQAEYSQAALPIVELLQRLPVGSSSITLDIVRPGTFAALKLKLRTAKEKNKQYHLVHLDVHGTVRKKFAFLHFADEEVPSLKVAELLRDHEIIYSVINACESAKADQSGRGNLAKVFTQAGIPHVLAMSYELQISAVKILLGAFYGSFLESGNTFAESAAVARKAMRETRVRIAKFGIEIELNDWIVPVVYSSSDIDPGVKTSKKLGPPQDRPWASWLRRKQGGPPELASLQGRDRDVLRIENKLLDNEEADRGRLLLLSGKYGCGKTALLRFLQRWWFITGWTLDPIYVDMEASGIDTPSQLCKLIYKKHARKGLAPLKELGDRPLHHLLQDMYDGQEGPEQSKRRPLLILDHLPRVFPLARWKTTDINSYKAKADVWRSFFADLSSAAAYTIVGSYDFPWYIDTHPTTEWPWETYYILKSPKTSYSHLTEHTGRSRTLKELLESPRNTEMLEMVLKWSGESYPLHQVMGTLMKESGFETIVQGLQTNVDLLRCSAFNSAEIRSQKVFGVAEELWKQCMDVEKSILLSFSPFHGHLPRCYESYVRDFCLGRLELRRPVRDWFLNRAPKPSVDQYWATVNRSTAALVNTAARLLIVRLKKAGLIEAVAICSPTHMDDDLDPQLRDQAEGTKIYSIHPIFTLFLRHQAHREGYGHFGDTSEKSRLLIRIFVEHHDLRTFEWLQGLGAGSIPWDTYIESFLGRQNFVAVLEQKLHDTSLMKHDTAPIPLFLAWCLMTCNGYSSHFVTTRFSPDVIAEYCTKAWPYAISKVSQAISSGYFTLAVMLTPIFQMAAFLMSRSLTSNNIDQLRQTLVDLDKVLETIPHDLSLLCAHGPGDDLRRLVEAVERFRRVGNGQDSCAYLTFCELALGTPEPNQILAESWATIAQFISVYRDTATLYERDEAFSFWDNAALDSEVCSITITSDDIFATLAPRFKDFLAKLDDETRTRFLMVGFTQAAEVHSQNDPSDMALVQALNKDGLAPPNYAAIVMKYLQSGRSLSEAHTDFDLAQSSWLDKMKQRSSVLKRLSMLYPASRYDDLTGLPNYGAGLSDDGTRVFFEQIQVKSFILMNDYQSLKEYLELVGVEVRAMPLKSLDVSQLRHRIWWYNIKGLCDIKLQDWQSANHHSSEAVRLARHRQDESAQILFSSLRLRMMLYNSCTDRTIFGNDGTIAADSYWMVILTALVLGYQSSDKIYACNGVLFTLLIQATSKEKANVPNSVPSDLLHSLISAIIERRRPIELETELFRSIESLRRQVNYISLEFFNILRQLLEAAAFDVEASRAIMKEAEVHAFKHGGHASCGCRFAGDQRQRDFQADSLERLIPLLPRFEILDYRIEIPCMNGVASMVELWLGNKFRIPAENLDEKQILASLSQWHPAARD